MCIIYKNSIGGTLGPNGSTTVLLVNSIGGTLGPNGIISGTVEKPIRENVRTANNNLLKCLRMVLPP